MAPAAVTHTHFRCAAAMVGATPVRGIIYREKTLRERPKPLAPAVPAMQEQTARACLCLGWGVTRREEIRHGCGVHKNMRS